MLQILYLIFLMSASMTVKPGGFPLLTVRIKGLSHMVTTSQFIGAVLYWRMNHLAKRVYHFWPVVHLGGVMRKQSLHESFTKSVLVGQTVKFLNCHLVAPSLPSRIICPTVHEIGFVVVMNRNHASVSRMVAICQKRNPQIWYSRINVSAVSLGRTLNLNVVEIFIENKSTATMWPLPVGLKLAILASCLVLSHDVFWLFVRCLLLTP